MWHKIQTVGTIKSFVGGAVVPGVDVSHVAPVIEPGFWGNVKRIFTEPEEVLQENAGDKVYNFLEPFLDIVGVVSYPVASVIMATAGIMYILSFKEKAVTWMTRTSITYIIVQLLPLLTRALIDMIVAY